MVTPHPALPPPLLLPPPFACPAVATLKLSLAPREGLSLLKEPVLLLRADGGSSRRLQPAELLPTCDRGTAIV